MPEVEFYINKKRDMEIMETYDNREPHIDLPRRIAGNGVTNSSL